MKKISLLMCLCLSQFLFAQHKGNYDQQISRQNIVVAEYGNAQRYGSSTSNLARNVNPSANIILDVQALYNAKATSYTAIFNISQIGPTAEDANKLVNERIDNVRKQLLAIGIKKEDIAIDVISFVPVYEIEVQKKLFSTKYNEVPKGFELQQNIHIQFKKTQQFEKILAACASNEIYNLVKVDYFIENIRQVYKKLQDSLLALIKEKKEYYKMLGFDLADYNVIMADDKYCYFPKDFYKNYQAFNSISFEALERKKGVTKAKKQTSYYYQPISYENYDIVLNAAILEPVIQVGMHIKLVYSPKPKEQKPAPKTEIKTEHKYYVISPDGKIDVKELKSN
ncbi:SIMPL domain-containing protein [Kordia sp. YSTF-M3]|uniref:SIMPL domain-containing protein n=1 Tax=Kordia aestuariivivens TaxID=2759037 RepID=A0ABR7Q435_9FLAO|nr:SIMPL domain-containing protein [Kordia aestuariivivens]MBC8753109.1 SIMPL domain-containing protein [Kordia aestuariivivens]